MSDDETVIPELPCFPPPSLEEVLREFDSLDVSEDVQFPMPLDFDMSFYQDLCALSLTSSSESAYSTGLTGEDISKSEYSFMTYTTSDYPPLFDLHFDLALRDIICDSEYNYVGLQSFAFSDLPMIPNYFGTPQLSPQHDHVIKMQPDDGPERQSVGISPHCLSATLQIPPPAVPIDPPVDDASATQVFTGPIRTKFTCLQCGHGKYNFYLIPFIFEILNVSLQFLIGNLT